MPSNAIGAGDKNNSGAKMSPDDMLDGLYREGQRIASEWLAAYVANLNRLSRELGSQRQFAIDLGHLVPRPHHAMSNGDDKQGMPPPLPSQGLTEDELDQAWFDSVQRQREQWRNGAA